MGDKTQIATVALAARFDSLMGVVMGTTAGMMMLPLLPEAAVNAFGAEGYGCTAPAVAVLGVVVLSGRIAAGLYGLKRTQCAWCCGVTEPHDLYRLRSRQARIAMLDWAEQRSGRPHEIKRAGRRDCSARIQIPAALTRDPAHLAGDRTWLRPLLAAYCVYCIVLRSAGSARRTGRSAHHPERSAAPVLAVTRAPSRTRPAHVRAAAGAARQPDRCWA